MSRRKTESQDSEDKKKFLDALSESGGKIGKACQASGVTYYYYEKYYDSDPEFAQLCDYAMRAQGVAELDEVEDALMKKIRNGDTTAIIFYLKTKGKDRGYTEKPQPKPEPTPPTVLLQPVEEDKKVLQKVKNKKDYIVKILKKQGKYTAELSMQVNITATLLVRYDMLAGEIFAGGHQAIKVETSREGNQRASIDPKERLFLDVSRQCQRALQALGMNTDAKDRGGDADSFNEFMDAFNSEDE